ncbi:MAG: hypothetical protein AAGA55_12215, partial [Planctomycetota bacterium]
MSALLADNLTRCVFRAATRGFSSRNGSGWEEAQEESEIVFLSSTRSWNPDPFLELKPRVAARNTQRVRLSARRA